MSLSFFKKSLSYHRFSFITIVLISHYVMYLIHVYQVNLAESFLARLPSQTQAALIHKDYLQIVETPWDELPRQALILTSTNLTHETIMKNVLVIRREPHIVVLLLCLAKYSKWISWLKCNRVSLRYA